MLNFDVVPYEKIEEFFVLPKFIEFQIYPTLGWLDPDNRDIWLRYGFGFCHINYQFSIGN
jgi:hypothetical protein